MLRSARILGLTLLMGSGYAIAAGPHHEACLPAADYAGCIKVLTEAEAEAARSGSTTTTVKIDQTNRPGLLREVGNDCPSGMAYAGAGKCRNIVCVHGGLFGRNDRDLAGKGHRCPAGMGDYIGYRGSLRWGNQYTNATINPSCPQVEPRIGYSNSCLSSGSRLPKGLDELD